MKKIQFSDLGVYSETPKNLLSSNNYAKRIKSKTEIVREFDKEKWQDIVNLVVNDDTVSLQEIDEIFSGFQKTNPFVSNNEFFLGTGRDCFDQHLNLFKEVLFPYLRGASCFVELGAGYGSKILNLAKILEIENMPLYAFEFTEKGRQAIDLISKRLGININVGECDFSELKIDQLDVPKGGVLFTSYAMHYVPQLSNSIVEYLLELQPKAIINFEPSYEHHGNSIYGLMCKKYIEINDYNKNIHSVLTQRFSELQIDYKIRKNVIGSNPFLPISVFEWFPNS